MLVEDTITVAMVVNQRYGGFGLSIEAAELFCKRKGIALHRMTERGLEHHYYINDHEQIQHVYGRSDPDLIAVVRELGVRANGESADLKVVDVTVHLEVTNEFGWERVNAYGHG